MAKKKKWQAIKADVGEYEGVRHDGKEYRFGYNDTFSVSDEGLMREMDSIHGKKGTQKIAFAEYNDHETRELGHTYTFGASQHYANAWEQFEKRRKDKPLPKKRNKRRMSAEVDSAISSH